MKNLREKYIGENLSDIYHYETEAEQRLNISEIFRRNIFLEMQELSELLNNPPGINPEENTKGKK